MKTEIKHTPGKISESEREKHLCGPEEGCTSCDDIRRIIDAAPELLGACKAALVRLEGGNQEERDFNKGIAEYLRNAISKADGK